ncbi:MAG: TetR/AcrR family transcriptional regulator [Candidatus Hydrogenedentes bacterium]|nr:TetR/AcrR family transcriptional regulator [Candidatus Hydrogenedentota bacterium]
MTRPSCKEFILESAEAVVLGDGAGKLTLDAVAKRAKVSKGGVLYHFPTKEALVEAMVNRLVSGTAARRDEALAALSDSPARELKAELSSLLQMRDKELRVGAALLAVVANEPKLLQPVVEIVRKRFGDHAGTGTNGLRRAMLLLAADGLHFLELLQISPLNESQRAAIVDEMNHLAEEWTP